MFGKKKASDTILIGNAHHIGARDSQQDSFAISDMANYELRETKGVFGVVADGIGGMSDGGKASTIATQTMLQYFNEATPTHRTEIDLLNMLYAANQNVVSVLDTAGAGGSTVVAVVIYGGKLYWAAVGDSRIYLIRNGGIVQINREHTNASELDEKAVKGEITHEAAASDPMRNALTAFLGMGELAAIDRSVRPVKLLAGDRIVLMTDGVFGVLDDNEILSAMNPKTKPHKSTALLQKMILTKNNPAQDNFTAIVFEYIGSRAREGVNKNEAIFN